MDNKIHTFSNGVMVYQKHLLDLQLERYAINNVHEPVEEEWFLYCINLCHHVDCTFLDVGAGIGYYSILALLQCHDMEVHAYEPNESLRQHLMDNIHLNNLDSSSIICHPEALADQCGERKFLHRDYSSVLLSDSNWFFDTITSFFISKRHHTQVTRVTTTTIDKEIGRLGKPIELMKIDVQGAELEVLLGAQASLYDNRIRHLMVGTHSGAIHKSCVKLLEKFPYRFLYNNDNVTGQPDGLIVAQAIV